MSADVPDPVRFDDPRSASIHERLARLGDGPASMYRDMHRITTKPLIENAASALVHFVRELKSSVEKVLLPPDFERPETNGNAAAIASILKRFGLPSDHAIGNIWRELEPHKIVHRRALGRPLMIDAVRGKLADFDRLLEMLLEELEKSYASSIYQKVDALLQKAQPGDKDVSAFRNEIPQNARALGYFFENADVALWLGPLRRKGIFDEEPSIAAWPMMHFLQRAAQSHTDAVLEILGSMPMPQAAIHQMRYLDVVEHLPLDRQGELALKVATSTKELEDYVARTLGNASKRIAPADAHSALAITRELLTLRVREPKTGWLGDIHSGFDVHTYGFIASEIVPSVVENLPEEALQTFADLLDMVLTQSHADRKPDDVSKGWRGSIAPHEQNRFFDPIEHLAETTRYSAEAACAADLSRLISITTSLQHRGWFFFTRLAIHLITKFGDPTSTLARDALMNDAYLQERDFRREFHLLLSKVYPHLSSIDQRALIDRIVTGPSLETTRNLTPDYAADYRERWIARHLGWIAEHLPVDVQPLYETLVASHGAPTEQDDFSGWMSTMWVGPTSPLEEERLASLTLEELLHLLAQWTPEGHHMVPTREGLGRDLQKVAKSRAAEFSASAARFKTLDATYIRNVLGGLEAAVIEGVAIEWDATLELCAWVVAQDRIIPGRDSEEIDDDPHWGWARAAVGRLLQAGFMAKAEVAVPLTLRRQVWMVLEPLTLDPDPDEDRGAQLRDPMTTAINSTRGVAMEAVMRYLGWARGRTVGHPEDATSFEDLPEARRVLDAHLDPTIEPSPAIRAVYGQWLFFLDLYAPDWFSAKIERFFPQSDKELADVTLESYVLYGQYTSERVRKLLDMAFRRSIERLPKGEDPSRTEREYSRKLGQSLVLAYVDGDASFDADSLLSDFFNAADVETRSHTLASAVHELETSGEKEAAMVPRLVALWEWRVVHGEPRELSAFGRWISEERLDPEWRLGQLEHALATAGDLDYEFDLIRSLAQLASSYPVAVLRCAKLAIENAISWRLYSYVYDGEMRRLLETCVAAGDLEVSKQLRVIANMLVSHDFLEFRDLAELRFPGE